MGTWKAGGFGILIRGVCTKLVLAVGQDDSDDNNIPTSESDDDDDGRNQNNTIQRHSSKSARKSKSKSKGVRNAPASTRDISILLIKAVDAGIELVFVYVTFCFNTKLSPRKAFMEL